jgi:UDP-3-O-[3-hydroxymyristoyl] glucosamine N-acyltransferase
VTDRHALTAQRIAELIGGTLIGDGDAVVDCVAPIDASGPTALTFLASGKYAANIATCRASVLLVTEQFQDSPALVSARIVVRNPQEAMLAILPHLYETAEPSPGVDPTSRIGRGARIGQGVSIGPFVVIGAGAAIGDRVRLDAHVVVGEGVIIGAESHLSAGVTVHSGATLGSRVVLHAGARIGNDGFGYVFSGGGHARIPHVGRCIIEDDVEIGANTTVDRGSIDDTVIGTGTRIDNLVQIAHNVRIGRHCLIMSQVGIAGSARIGDGCVLAGQVGVAGHLTIGDGARVAGQAGVFGDIPAGETWSGYPARPHRESLRSHAALLKLSGMVKQIERLVSGTS